MLNTVVKKLPFITGNVICILSGGLDSTILLYLLKHAYGDNVIAVSYNYGQRHSCELKHAKLTCEITNTPHKIIDISFFGDIISPVSALSGKKEVDVPNIKDVLGEPQPVTYVPFRNALFSCLTLSVAESNNAEFVFMGLQAHDLYMYWDTTPEFIEAINNVAKLNREHLIQVQAPFVEFSKKQEIELGMELNVPFENTWTCYDPIYDSVGDAIACGRCPSCAERIKNFMDAGVVDPIPYKVKINWDC